MRRVRGPRRGFLIIVRTDLRPRFPSGFMAFNVTLSVSVFWSSPHPPPFFFGRFLENFGITDWNIFFTNNTVLAPAVIILTVFFPGSYSPESGEQKKNQNYSKIRGATPRIFIFILFLRKSVWKSFSSEIFH